MKHHFFSLYGSEKHNIKSHKCEYNFLYQKVVFYPDPEIPINPLTANV